MAERYVLRSGRPARKPANKPEFSKRWLVGCIAFTILCCAASYALAACGQDAVAELSVAIVQIMGGTSGASFIGYVLQNSVRAYAADKYGKPEEKR